MKDVSKEFNLIPFERFEVGQSQTFGAYKVTEEEIIEELQTRGYGLA